MRVRLSENEARQANSRVLAAVERLVAVRVSELHCLAHKPIASDSDELTMLTRLGVRAESKGLELATYSQYRVVAIEDDAADEATPENTVWTVEVTLVAHWALSSEVGTQDAQCFAISQGALTCHPYAREVIQSATSRMSYPPATVDLLYAPLLGGDDEIEIDIPE